MSKHMALQQQREPRWRNAAATNKLNNRTQVIFECSFTNYWHRSWKPCSPGQVCYNTTPSSSITSPDALLFEQQFHQGLEQACSSGTDHVFGGPTTGCDRGQCSVQEEKQESKEAQEEHRHPFKRWRQPQYYRPTAHPHPARQQ